MNLNKIVGIDLKRLLSIDFKDGKNQLHFKKGEVLTGEVLEKLEHSLLVDLGEKGIVKAFSDVDIIDKRVFLKVIQTKPEVILKLLSKNDRILNTILNKFDEKEIKNFLGKFPELKEQLEFKEKDFNNIELLKEKIKNLPDKLGLKFEKELFECKVSKENLKFKTMEFIKSNSENNSAKNILQFIEHNQTLNNNMQMFLPLFFNNSEIDKGFIFYKQLNKAGSTKKQSFNIVILLNLTEDRVLQVNLLSVGKNLSLTFISNKEKFLNKLKENINELSSKLNSFQFSLLSTSFKFTEKLDNTDEIEKIFHNTKKVNIIDIKT